MDWFISDTHYHHKNIIRGISEWPEGKGTRNFPDFESHDAWLVNTINEKVMPDDTLWHLGDWSFGGIQQVAIFRDRLAVRNVNLLLGNHDHNISKANEQRGWSLFNSVQQYAELKFDGVQLVLMHYPIASWNYMDRGAIHLHGHVHGNIAPMLGRYDVGVDSLGLISLDEVRQLKASGSLRHGHLAGGNKFGT